MESLLHQNSKVLLDARRSSAVSRTAPPSSPPPAYSPPAHAFINTDFDAEYDEDDDDDEEDEDNPTTPHIINIDASTVIEGDFNVVGTDVAEMGARASAVLSSIIKSPELSRIPLQINLNCGVRVLGQRNVIANLRWKPPLNKPNAAATHPDSGKRSADEALLNPGPDPKRPNFSSNA